MGRATVAVRIIFSCVFCFTDKSSRKIYIQLCIRFTNKSFIMFNVVKLKVCRNSLFNILMLISEMCNFNMKREHGIILSNILFQNYCLFESPRTTEEPAVKVLKLS